MPLSRSTKCAAWTVLMCVLVVSCVSVSYSLLQSARRSAVLNTRVRMRGGPSVSESLAVARRPRVVASPAPAQVLPEDAPRFANGDTERIPRHIHQYWNGPNPPHNLMHHCREMHADWNYTLWTPESIRTLARFHNLDLFENYGRGEINGQSDIMRFSVLREMGGIYLDADTLCLRRLDPFLRHGFFASYEAKDNFDAANPRSELVATGVIGGVAQHPLLVELTGRLKTQNVLGPAWWVAGPGYMERVLKACGHCNASGDVRVFPFHTFLPYHHSEAKSASTSGSLPHLLPKVALHGSFAMNLWGSTFRNWHMLKNIHTPRLAAPNAPFVLYVMNIPAGAACRHKNNVRPLVCISTSESGARIVRVKGPDVWSQLGQRMLQALPQIYARHNASWYFKIDTDTATDSLRLEQALRRLPPDVAYVGQVYSYDNSPDYASGGAGYGVRRAALAVVSPARCGLVPSAHTNYEDVTIGACLHKHGVAVAQLDGLYGDSAYDSALLASGALVYANHRFVVNATVPVLTMHKSSIDCLNSTVYACVRPQKERRSRHLFHTFQGQLGNQLFQYAAVLGIARRNAMVPCLHGDPLGPFFDGVESHACVRRDGTPVFSENGGYATYHDFRFEHDAVLDGYLQSFRYFPSNARAALRIKPALQRQAAATLAGLPAGVRVALHVRRRHDALEYLRLPGAAYYRQAMALFRARHAAAVFVVVSDDVAWCRAQPHFRHADVHVQRPGQAPAADLALLAACDHAILSRGTFGWWGAYLGADARNGSVVYYDREFDMSSPINKGHVEPRDFYPPRWMALGGG